jgi:hypothetical protein
MIYVFKGGQDLLNCRVTPLSSWPTRQWHHNTNDAIHTGFSYEIPAIENFAFDAFSFDKIQPKQVAGLFWDKN